MVCRPLGVTKIFSGVQKVKDILIIMLRCYLLFSTVSIFALMARKQLRKTLGSLSGVKAVAKNCTGGHFSSHPGALFKKNIFKKNIEVKMYEFY